MVNALRKRQSGPHEPASNFAGRNSGVERRRGESPGRIGGVEHVVCPAFAEQQPLVDMAASRAFATRCLLAAPEQLRRIGVAGFVGQVTCEPEKFSGKWAIAWFVAAALSTRSGGLDQVFPRPDILRPKIGMLEHPCRFSEAPRHGRRLFPTSAVLGRVRESAGPPP